MKSKEAIRKDIIHYANLIWETTNINNLNPLVHLLIEEVCNELFLMQNQLENIHAAVLEKLIQTLLPTTHYYARPCHTVMHIQPECISYKLNKNTGFLLKEISGHKKGDMLSNLMFTPVTDVNILDITITHLFFDKTLWTVSAEGDKKVVGYADKKAAYNTLWIGIDAKPEIQRVDNLSFFLDFPHLPNHHIYFEMLDEIHWQFNGKPLKMKQGLYINKDASPTRIESDIIDFYKDHFQTIIEEIRFDEEQKTTFPNELSGFIDQNITSPLPLMHWFSVSFPKQFDREDIAGMSVQINAFPVINRQYNDILISGETLSDSDKVSLSSKPGQEFLEMENVSDSIYRTYQQKSIPDQPGTYSVEITRRKPLEEVRIADHLERLADVIHEERSSFQGIDNDRIMEVLNKVSSIQNNDGFKSGSNRLADLAEVALLTLKPDEDTHSVLATYWTTFADLANDIPEKTKLAVNKVPELTKSIVTFLLPTIGGRNFYDKESLKAINRFYLTSKDRILTKSDILNFCYMELGGYIKEVDVVRKSMISPKLKQGIINVMEIQLKTHSKQLAFLKKKNTCKELLVRLKQRSPGNYYYRINCMAED